MDSRAGPNPEIAPTRFVRSTSDRSASPATAGAQDRWIDDNAEDLSRLYQHLHSHPELSLKEVETARQSATTGPGAAG